MPALSIGDTLKSTCTQTNYRKQTRILTVNLWMPVLPVSIYTEEQCLKCVQAFNNLETFLLELYALKAKEFCEHVLDHHWYGDKPLTYNVDDLFLKLGNLLQTNRITVLQHLCVRGHKHFAKWWNPESMLDTMQMLPKFCPEHSAVWEPYYAALRLQGSWVFSGIHTYRFAPLWTHTQDITFTLKCTD